MKISRTGIILNTEKYDECVSFYGELFDLKILFKENEGGLHRFAPVFSGVGLAVSGTVSGAGSIAAEADRCLIALAMNAILELKIGFMRFIERNYWPLRGEALKYWLPLTVTE